MVYAVEGLGFGMDLVSVFCYADNRLVLFCFFVVFLFWFIFLYLAGIFSFVYSGHLMVFLVFFFFFLALFLGICICIFELGFSFLSRLLFYHHSCICICIFRVLSATNLFWIRRCCCRRRSFSSFFRYPLLEKGIRL